VERTDCGKSNTSAALAIEVSYFTSTMKVVATPDSAVPSLTERALLLYIDTDDVTRVLFDIDTPSRSSCPPRVLAKSGWYRQRFIYSDVSVGSLALSLVTCHLYWQGRHPGDTSFTTQPTSTLLGVKARLRRSKVGDDVVIESSCHGGLNLRLWKWQKIFDIFDGSEAEATHKAYSLILRLTFNHPHLRPETSTTVENGISSTGKSTQREKSRARVWP
jgi:hypothetical protein